jgi:hypothetical protein
MSAAAATCPIATSHAAGFANPTVYCRDVWKLRAHILDAVCDVVEVQRFLRMQEAQQPEDIVAMM